MESLWIPRDLQTVSDEWRGYPAPSFQPTEAQQAMMNAVQAALDDGAFYSSEVLEHVAAQLHVTAKQRTVGPGVEGGSLGMDCYYARDALRQREMNSKRAQAHSDLDPKVGRQLGTLMFNDYKRTTGCVIVEVDGPRIRIRGKRGSVTAEATTDALTLANAANRAVDRGVRKAAQPASLFA